MKFVKIISIILILTLFLSKGGILAAFNEKISSEEARDYYRNYAILLESIGNSSDVGSSNIEANNRDELFEKGKLCFNQEYFLEAIDYFTLSLSQNLYNMEAHYYVAKCFYALGEKDQALKVANFILNQGKTDFKDMYTFKSVIEQTDKNYQKAIIEEEKAKLNGGYKRFMYSIMAILALILIGSLMVFMIKKNKYKYSDVLKKLYIEIEKANTFGAGLEEAEADTSGIEG